MAKLEDGTNGAYLAGVDGTLKALRTTPRPPEGLAFLSLGVQSGAATVIAANGPMFSFRNIGANPIGIRRLGVGFVATTAFTAAQLLDFGLFVARSFSASDSGQTAITLTGNNTKLRTSHVALTNVDCRISTTAAITAGTRTLDTNALGIASGWATTAAGVIIAPSKDNLLGQEEDVDYPLILATNEGIIVAPLTTMGAGGVGRLIVNMQLNEMISY